MEFIISDVGKIHNMLLVWYNCKGYVTDNLLLSVRLYWSNMATSDCVICKISCIKETYYPTQYSDLDQLVWSYGILSFTALISQTPCSKK